MKLKKEQNIKNLRKKIKNMSAQASANSTASNKALNENLILKSYEKKVKEDIRLISDNLLEMIKLLKIETDSTLKVV